MFDTLQLPLDAPDHKVAKAFGTLWTNMAKYGDPNGNTTLTSGPASAQVFWPKFETGTDQHLEITEKLAVGTGLANTRCDFWDALPRQGPYPT